MSSNTENVSIWWRHHVLPPSYILGSSRLNHRKLNCIHTFIQPKWEEDLKFFCMNFVSSFHTEANGGIHWYGTAEGHIRDIGIGRNHICYKEEGNEYLVIGSWERLVPILSDILSLCLWSIVRKCLSFPCLQKWWLAHILCTHASLWEICVFQC